MTRLEMVEKLQEKTGVAYEVARDTLEDNNWDVLDAVRELDKNAQENSRHSDSPSAADTGSVTESKHKGHSEFGRKFRFVLKWILNWIARGESVRLEILCHDEVVGSISLTALILLFLLKWFIPAVLLIAGSSAAGKFLNSLSSKAQDKAEEFKNKMNEK